MKLGLGLGINKMRGRPPRKPEGEPLALRSAPTPEPEAQAMSAAAPVPNEPPKRKGFLAGICARLKAVCMRLNNRIKEAARELANREGITLSQFIERALRKEISEAGKQIQVIKDLT